MLRLRGGGGGSGTALALSGGGSVPGEVEGFRGADGGGSVAEPGAAAVPSWRAVRPAYLWRAYCFIDSLIR